MPQAKLARLHVLAVPAPELHCALWPVSHARHGFEYSATDCKALRQELQRTHQARSYTCRFSQDVKPAAQDLPKTEDLPRWATVGPAQYHVKLKGSGPAASIGNDMRFPPHKAALTPGPGLYRV